VLWDRIWKTNFCISKYISRSERDLGSVMYIYSPKNWEARADGLSLTVQNQPGQHKETPISKGEVKKFFPLRFFPRKNTVQSVMIARNRSPLEIGFKVKRTFWGRTPWSFWNPKFYN
jgi:hypothetical protein